VMKSEDLKAMVASLQAEHDQMRARVFGAFHAKGTKQSRLARSRMLLSLASDSNTIIQADTIPDTTASVISLDLWKIIWNLAMVSASQNHIDALWADIEEAQL